MLEYEKEKRWVMFTVTAGIYSYEEAAEVTMRAVVAFPSCPDYIPRKDSISTPRVVKFGNNPLQDILAMWGESENINPDPMGNSNPPHKFSERSDIPSGLNIPRTSNNISKTSNIPRTTSFSGLSAAALSANTTLANTNICNGLLGEEILPSWDSIGNLYIVNVYRLPPYNNIVLLITGQGVGRGS
ncbi:hypothetical protein ACFE04_013665 [Oxalis oulophora]